MRPRRETRPDADPELAQEGRGGAGSDARALPAAGAGGRIALRRQQEPAQLGDNLDALQALLPYYAGRVKCITFDPPYSTLLETYERGRRSASRLTTPTNPRHSVEGSGTTLAVNWKLSNASPSLAEP